MCFAGLCRGDSEPSHRLSASGEHTKEVGAVPEGRTDSQGGNKPDASYLGKIRQEFHDFRVASFQPGWVVAMTHSQRWRILVCLLIWLMQGSSVQPAHASMMADWSLSPCPDSPNCVSSQAGDARHAIAPFSFSGTRSEARETLLSILQSMSRTRIISIEHHVIQVEFISALFRFVDDAEFYFPEDEQRIHVRSASRVGYYDFGVNRARLERIRALLQAKGPP
jgi:uncharacterized protein (DUF1499 family)